MAVGGTSSTLQVYTPLGCYVGSGSSQLQTPNRLFDNQYVEYRFYGVLRRTSRRFLSRNKITMFQIFILRILVLFRRTIFVSFLFKLFFVILHKSSNSSKFLSLLDSSSFRARLRLS
jgi:hypothetical protein